MSVAISEPPRACSAVFRDQRTQELGQLLRGRVVGQPQVGVEFVVGRLLGTKHFDGNLGLLQHGTQTFCLRSGVGVPSNMKNQEGRDALPFRHMGDG